MTINFPFILLALTSISGIIALVDIIFWAPKRKKSIKPPIIAEYARSFFFVLLAVFLVRSFLIQPYRVPSGSLEPTVLPGEMIVVNQFSYGLKFPVWNKKILPLGKPKRGDIVVFHWPVNPSINFVKRVVGIPGDSISYINKVLYVNGKKAEQKLVGFTTDRNKKDGPIWKVKILQENLAGIKHKIYVCDKNAVNCPNPKPQNFCNLVVPEGHYLMMGDNRDDSEDGRVWGFVPEKYIVGKAFLVVISWDSYNMTLRWKRTGHIL